MAGRKRTSDEVQEHGRRIGRLIRERRDSRRMTRAELAQGSSVSAQQVAKLETGHVGDPGFLLVAKLAEVLELGLDYLHAHASGREGGQLS